MFSQNVDCERAFEELKKRLCKTPILGYTDASGQFVVDADASNIGIGGGVGEQETYNRLQQ